MKSITHITSINKDHDIFLLEDGGKYFLVNISPSRGIHDCMCPCCLWKEEREAVKNVVENAFTNGEITKKVIWCDDSYGERLETGDLKDAYVEFKSEHYTWEKGGSSNISHDKRLELMKYWAKIKFLF